MSIYKNIKALFDRSGLVGGGGPDLAPVQYLPQHRLPGDAGRMIRAGLAEHWRTDSDGVEWYKVTGDTIAAVADFDPDPDDFDDDSDLVDDEDLFDDDDDFDGDYEDEEVDDYD